MDATQLDKLTRWAEGQLISGDPAATITTVCTDSRSLRAGDLFIALRGESFDGHEFVAEAAKRGATAAIVSDVLAGMPEGFGIIRADDTLLALQRIAKATSLT